MCDLSDPKILQAYTEIEQYEPTDWMLLGYNDTRDVISLYSKGTGGLSEFREHLSDEVLYGFVRVDDRFILITWVSEQVSGVRRARALVHSRSVAGLLKSHHAQITASSLNDVSDNNIRTRLKLGENQVPNRSRPPSMSERKRSSMQARRQSTQQQQENGRATTPDDTDHFVEAYEDTPPSPVAMDEEDKIKADAARERAMQAAAEEERARAEAQARAEAEAKQRADEEAAAAAKAAEKEAKRRKQQEEQERAQRRAEEEERSKKEEEKQRAEAEKLAMQKRMQEAEKSKDVLLVGFVSVQPSSSPFWRRRYVVVRGKNLVLYRDELDKTPVAVIDLRAVTRLSPIDQERETYLPNAFVLNTQKDGAFQICADNKKDLSTVMTALQTVVQAK